MHGQSKKYMQNVDRETSLKDSNRDFES